MDWSEVKQTKNKKKIFFLFSPHGLTNTVRSCLLLGHKPRQLQHMPQFSETIRKKQEKKTHVLMLHVNTCLKKKNKENVYSL